MKNSRWFRLYSEIAHDPKVQALPPELFRFWINCMCLSCEDNGLIPSGESIDWQLHLAAGTGERMVMDLYSAGLVDLTNIGPRLHNWEERQTYKSSTSRVRRHRDMKRNETHETLHDVSLKVKHDETSPAVSLLAKRDETSADVSNVSVTIEEKRVEENRREEMRESCVPPPSPRIVPLTPQPAWTKDPEFLEFKTEYESTGASFTDQDWIEGHGAWKYLDFEQKAICLTGFREQRAGGMWGDPQRIYRPAKYIRTGEYKRKAATKPQSRPVELRQTVVDPNYERKLAAQLERGKLEARKILEDPNAPESDKQLALEVLQ